MYETIGDGRQDEGLIPLVGAMAPNAEVSPSWYVRDRLRNYSGRYVVVMVDLRVHWSLVGPVFLTSLMDTTSSPAAVRERHDLRASAVREEHHHLRTAPTIGEWTQAYRPQSS